MPPNSKMPFVWPHKEELFVICTDVDFCDERFNIGPKMREHLKQAHPDSPEVTAEVYVSLHNLRLGG